MKLYAILLTVFATFQAQSYEMISVYEWDVLEKENKIKSGAVVTAASGPITRWLEIENESSEPQTFAILDIQAPPISADHYLLTGRVRYEGVDGKGYLETLNRFGEEEYFSRTLAEEGPMRALEGDSDWRDFSVPFYITDNSGRRPDRIRFNLHLPGKGKVAIGPIELSEKSLSDGWWSQAAAGYTGVILGSLGGIFGVLMGIAGYFSQSGHGKTFAFATVGAAFALGLLQLAIGLIAVGWGQPYHVYYPPLLCGIIFTAVSGISYPVFRRNFESSELRRMKAMDVGS